LKHLILKKGDDEGWMMSPSEFVPNIVDGTEQYKSKKKSMIEKLNK